MKVFIYVKDVITCGMLCYI